MRESPEHDSLNKVWLVLFYLGMIFVPFALLAAVIRLPLRFQPTLALLSSVCWIISSLLLNRQSNKLERIKHYPPRLFLTGVVQALLAVSFLTIVTPKTEIAHWLSYINTVLGLIAFLIFYIAIIFYLFPEFSKTIPDEYNSNDPGKKELKSIHDPLSGLSNNVRVIINEGKDFISKVTINVLTVGSLMIMISMFLLGSLESPLNFLMIEVLVIMILTFGARYFAMYKWQKGAMKSGIPEKKLEAAAKRAGLWWPNTKSQK